MSKPWEILGKLAEKKSEDARVNVQLLGGAIQRAELRHQQIKSLIFENHQRLSKGKGSSMAEVRVLTSFLSNLASLERAIQEELKVLRFNREIWIGKLNQAKREVTKMDSLMEREEERMVQNKLQRSAREMDAAGIARYNMGKTK